MIRSLPACLTDCQDDLEGYYGNVRALGGPDGIVWDTSIDAWVITSYSLCKSLLVSPYLRRQRVALPRHRNADLVECAESILNSQLMFCEGASPRRAYWAARLSKAFSDSQEAQLRQIAMQCIEDTSPQLDLYVELLQPFASRVAATSVGLDEEDRKRLYPLITQYVRFLDGKIRSERDFDAAMFSIVTLYDQLGALFRHGDTQAHDSLHHWNADLLLSLVAGHESTAYLLATALLNLDSFPKPHSLRPALVESLRFDAPVQMIGRTVAETFEVGQAKLLTDSKVYLHIGAANRDPEAFQFADQFRLDRAGPPPIAFGVGDGQCIGRSVAMRSALAFLEGLAQRHLWFEVYGPPVRASGLSGRGFQHLPARLVRDASVTTAAGVTRAQH